MRQHHWATLAAAALMVFATNVAVIAKPVVIRAGYIVPVTNILSMMFEQKGIAKHYGKSYTVEKTHFRGSTLELTAMGAGDLDVALLGYTTITPAIKNAKLDVRIIADEIRDGYKGYYSDEYMVRKNSSIKTVADLKGKVLATNARGSGVDVAMRAMLRRSGLKDSDVTIVEAAIPNYKSMLLQKRADLIIGVPPFAYDPKLRTNARTLFTQRQAMGGTSMLAFWVARTSFIKKHRAALVDFLEDYLRTVHYYTNPAHREEGVDLAAKMLKAPRAMFESWLFTKKDYYRNPDALPDLKGLVRNMKTQRDLGFVHQIIDPEKYADLSLIKEAAARLK